MHCLDTDVIIDFLRGQNKTLELNNATTTVVNAQEVLFGLRNRPEQQQRVREFLEAIEILPYDSNDVAAVVCIKTELTKQGGMIGILDEIIAGICLTNNLTLVTRNTKHFKKVKGLKLKAW